MQIIIIIAVAFINIITVLCVRTTVFKNFFIIFFAGIPFWDVLGILSDSQNIPKGVWPPLG